MKINDGGPAFPTPHRPLNWESGAEGMSLRDWMAVKFAAAWVRSISTRRHEHGYTDEGVLQEANRLGLIQADAMLQQREAQP